MYIWKNVIVFVQQIPNINKQGNKNECFQKQTFLIYIVLFLEKVYVNQLILQTLHSIQSHFTTSAQYPITCYKHCNVSSYILQPVHSIQSHFTTSAPYPVTCYNQCTISNHMYLDSYLPTKTCEAPRCVSSLYRPAHHMNWLQVLTPTVNTANCHMYMSTAVPADAQRYVTQWYQHTPEGISWIETVLEFCSSKIISDILTKAKQTLFHYSRLRHKRSLLLEQQQ